MGVNGRDEKGRFADGHTIATGRPKKNLSIPDILRKIGDETWLDKNKKPIGEKLEVIMRNVFQEALKGKSWAVEFIANRTEGKPIQSMIIDTHKPITLIRTGIPEVDEEE